MHVPSWVDTICNGWQEENVTKIAYSCKHQSEVNVYTMEGYVYIGMNFSVENIYIAMGLKQYFGNFGNFCILNFYLLVTS